MSKQIATDGGNEPHDSGPTASPPKPLPRPSAESRPFWEGCKRHELLLQRCSNCQKWWHPPSSFCPRCWSTQWEWRPASGRGKVFSRVVFERVYHPAFRDEAPYDVAVIELDEGPRILSNVVGRAAYEVRCGMAVEVVFEDVTAEVTLPKFRPIDQAQKE